MRVLWRLALMGCVLLAALVALHFPYATDAEPSPGEVAKTVAFYQQAYAAPTKAPGTEDDAYIQAATQAAKGWRVEERLQEFALAHQLGHKRVLEVGSGRGYLQDIVDDYTGLDISPR